MIPDDQGQAVRLPPQQWQIFNKQLLKRSRTPFTPDVILLEAPDGARYVLKDFSGRSLAARLLWCRFAVRRETSAYQRLNSVAGIPRLASTASEDAVLMEWLDAQPLPRRKQKDLLGNRFFEKLNTLVEQMHKAGVAHGDLRRKNILVSPDGDPCIIDFETAVIRGGTIQRRIFDAICRVDRITVLKIKAKYYPEDVTPEEKVTLEDTPWHLKIGRFFRQRVYGGLSPKSRNKRSKQARKKKARS